MDKQDKKLAELADKSADNQGLALALTMKRATLLARKRGWEAVNMEALYLLFADRYGWTPDQVRSLTTEELSLFADALPCGVS